MCLPGYDADRPFFHLTLFVLLAALLGATLYLLLG